jgi:hypothetical protein
LESNNLITTIILGIISPAVTAVIGFFAYGIVKRQFAFAQRQHQVHGLLGAFRVLDTEQHRDSRTRVYALYFDYLDTGELKAFKVSADVQTVRADFDILGKLVESNNIQMEEFLEEYGSLAYRCWKCLEKDIMDERDSRNFKPFMTYFQWLANEAYQYWKRKDMDLSKTKLYHPDDRSRRVDFQQK